MDPRACATVLVYDCMHERTCMYTHCCTQSHAHSRANTQIRALAHGCNRILRHTLVYAVHTHTYACTLMRAHLCKHTRRCTLVTYACALFHLHSHTHLRIRTREHTHTHMHAIAHSRTRLSISTFTRIHSFNAIYYCPSNNLFLNCKVHMRFPVCKIFYIVAVHKALYACLFISAGSVERQPYCFTTILLCHAAVKVASLLVLSSLSVYFSLIYRWA